MCGFTCQDGSGPGGCTVCKDVCAEVMPFSLFVLVGRVLIGVCVDSEVPRAVDAWRTELRTKNRAKTAASIAHPAENGALFEEGWDDALGREAEWRASRTQEVTVSE